MFFSPKILGLNVTWTCFCDFFRLRSISKGGYVESYMFSKLFPYSEIPVITVNMSYRAKWCVVSKHTCVAAAC